MQGKSYNIDLGLLPVVYRYLDLDYLETNVTMPHATSYQPTVREVVLLNHSLDITPLEAPLFAFPKETNVTPRSYLTPHTLPFGRSVAEWQNQFFGLHDKDLQFQTNPIIPPIRPGAPTLIALFYPDNDPEEIQRRSLEVYLMRITRLAALNEQTIIYTPPSLSQTIRGLRDDVHWHVIDEFETIWDIPNNRHQMHNFTHVQPKMFNNFECIRSEIDGWAPAAAYNHAHRSACYNAKAFVIFDAPRRNPFGSERWMYVDAGIFNENGPEGKDGKAWGDILRYQLSDEKIDRSISISGDTGVVVGEYAQTLAYGAKDINHPAWTDRRKSWMCQHFLAEAFVGNTLGMLNYSVRFMQTVDDMDANEFYTAREEFVIPHVAIRYPNTIFSIPWMEVERGRWDHPMKGCYLTYGGMESVPPIGDPIEVALCKGYKPRRKHVVGAGLYDWSWWKRVQGWGGRY
jgi:hypothetical protein